MNKVIVEFVDLQDNNHKYRVGDEYPRPGVVVSEERIEELKTNANKLKKPLIEEVIAEEKVEKPKRGRKKKNAD